MCRSFFNCFEKTMGTIGEYTYPQNPFVMGFAGFFLWYGRRVFLTYGPKILADFCISSTVKSVGNEIIGKAVGAVCVAPAMVPSITPIVSWVVGGAFFLLATIIGNLFSKFVLYLHHVCHKPKPVKRDISHV